MDQWLLSRTGRAVGRLRWAGLCAAAVLAVHPVSAADEPGPPPLPAFVAKVAFCNFAGVVPTADGQGVELARLPASVRAGLNEKAAEQMLAARNSEIRFVLNEGEKLDNVKVVLEPVRSVSVDFFYGDYQYLQSARQVQRKEALTFPSHGTYLTLMKSLPRGRFPNHLCRVVLTGGPVRLLGVEGDVRPPRPDELPPVMVSYGTSITQGAMASRGELAWNALTARTLGYDLVNLGASGSAFCEPAIAEHLAATMWDLCVLELSVNMLGEFSVEQFRERAAALVEKAAASHPAGHVVCISILPWLLDYCPTWAQYPKLQAFRRTLEEICAASGHQNVHFISGPSLLKTPGLTQDVLHPSDFGMIEIAQNLSAALRPLLPPARSAK